MASNTLPVRSSVFYRTFPCAIEELGKLQRLVLDSHGDKARTLYVGIKSIVRRESTAETSPSGRLVQKMLAFIKQNAIKGASVDDVVRHVGCSRRLAELRFHELQNLSIGEALIATRLEEVRTLLVTTRLPIESIANECGYGNPNYLKNLFKKTLRNDHARLPQVRRDR